MKNALMAALAVVIVSAACVYAEKDKEKSKETKKVPPVLNFKMTRLDGKPANLADYSGKVVLIVNVASHCGYTKQYKGLQGLHEKYAEKGLVVLGVPANEFGAQEPGTNDEIALFCKSEYDVKFDMLAKVVVKGEDICPLYKYLTSKETNPKHAGEIKWNFEKFVIGRNGEIAGRYASAVEPDSDELVEAIETELEKSK